MGVDCTLFVLADHSRSGRDGIGFIHHVFRLQRDSDLWDALGKAIKACKDYKWTEIQLPRGAQSTYEGGHVPDGWRDCEGGWLQRDCYGHELWSLKGKHFGGLERESEGDFPGLGMTWNEVVFAFIAEHLPDHDVVVFWH